MAQQGAINPPPTRWCPEQGPQNHTTLQGSTLEITHLLSSLVTCFLAFALLGNMGIIFRVAEFSGGRIQSTK
jgi:hypothetical protein